MKSKTSTNSSDRGIIMLKNIPHGFYEKEMREFLTQFGTVTNLRIARSPKSGKSKGYAFVEFMFKDVAKIVAETMNNYLMFEKLVKCQVVPSEKFHKNVFKGKINPLKPPSKMRRLAAKKELHATKTEKQNDKRNERQSRKLQKIQSKLEEFGVQLSVPKEEESMMKTPKAKVAKSAATTPIMEIDEDDEDIKLKTPPHVRKIKSRPNSTVNSAAGTPRNSKNSTPVNPKTNLAKLEKMLNASSKLKKTKVNSAKKSK